MAADVLMGTDRDCAAWIRANRDPERAGRRGRRASEAVGAGDRRSESIARGRSSHRLHAVGSDGTVEHGTTVLEAARRLGADLDTVCGGRGICGRCQVVPSVGTFAKWGLTVDVRRRWVRPASIETDYHGSRPLAAGHRLGCAATIVGDVVVDVPAASQVHRQVVRKDLDLPPITVDPVVHAATTSRSPRPSSATRSSAADAIARGRGRAARRAPSRPCRSASLAALQPALAGATVAVTVAVDERDRIVAVWPGFVDRACGVAVDVGSTTIAGHLCDLATGEVLASAGRMNPQIRFGEDLMSRVSYVMMNPGGDGELTEAVRDGARRADRRAASTRSRSYRDARARHRARRQPDHAPHRARHRPDAARPGAVHARHQPAVDHAAPPTSTWLSPNARCYVGPCIAGHVGADTAAAMLAEGPHRGRRACSCWSTSAPTPRSCSATATRQFAASSPTGPGVRGRADQLRAAGDRRRDRAGAHRPGHARTAVQGDRRRRVVRRARRSPSRSRRPGITGICGSGIIEVVAEMFLAGVIDPDGVIRGELAERTPARRRRRSHVLVRALRRRRRRSCRDHPERRPGDPAREGGAAGRHRPADRARRRSRRSTDIRLAGAFGAHIDPLHAMVLGLVPDCAASTVSARSATRPAPERCRRCCRARCAPRWSRRSRGVVKIETATEPRFQELFVAAMAFPHATAPTPHLAHVVTLPAAADTSDASSRRRRRRGSTDVTDPTTERRPSGRRAAYAGAAAAAATLATRCAQAAITDAASFLTRTMQPVRARVATRGSRCSSTTPTPSSRRSASRSATTRRRSSGSRDAGADVDGDAGALPARHVPADRAGIGARRSTRSTPATRSTTCRSAATPPCSPPTTGRRSCTTSTAAGATRRSPTSRTS